jgi:hypothetical protein
MTDPKSSTSQTPALSASYLAPTSEAKTFSHNVSSCQPDISTGDRTKYLSDLRSSVHKLQAEVNVFLTAKMEEDRKAELDGEKADEHEEENYGEEVAED